MRKRDLFYPCLTFEQGRRLRKKARPKLATFPETTPEENAREFADRRERCAIALAKEKRYTKRNPAFV